LEADAYADSDSVPMHGSEVAKINSSPTPKIVVSNHSGNSTSKPSGGGSGAVASEGLDDINYISEYS